jgi:hypothetical protein
VLGKDRSHQPRIDLGMREIDPDRARTVPSSFLAPPKPWNDLS